MARSRKRSKYVIVDSSILCCIGPERVLDLEEDVEDSLADELECPIADPVLESLRRIFSLTFSENPFTDGTEKAVTEIRRLGVEALVEIPQILEDLKLVPIPRPLSASRKAHVFRYFFVKDEELKMQVQYEGRKRSLHRLTEKWPGDSLVKTLRDVVSETFSEIYDEQQAEETLLRIRSKVWEVLPTYNELLIDIEVESMPIYDESYDNLE